MAIEVISVYMFLVPLVGAAEKFVVSTNTPYLPLGEEGESTQCPIPWFVRAGRQAGVAFVPIQGPAKVMSITLAISKVRPQAKAIDDSASSASDGTTNTLETVQGRPRTDKYPYAERLSS
jgi:TRAP-type mannitol/chloroaromatic compound transport system permease small subunit